MGSKPLVPRLRFPEFSASPGWPPESALGDAVSIDKGRGIAKADVDPNGGLPCIRYGELYTRYREVIKDVYSRTALSPAGLLLSRTNDVIIPASGETKEDIATASCVLVDGVALGSDLNVLRTEHNGVFLSYLLNGPKRRDIVRVAQGDAVVHLYPNQLAKIAVSFPHSTEQQKIADFLASLDELITAHTRRVEAVRKFKRGLMQNLFPREGDNLPRLRFRDYRSASEWVRKPIGEAFDTGSGGTPDRSKPEYWNGSIPWISTSLVDFNRIQSSQEFITEAGMKHSSAKLFPKGTVVVAMYGQGKTRGKAALLDIEATTNQACAAIFPNDEVEPEFTFLYVSGRYEQLRALSNSGSQDNLSQELIRGLNFAYPIDKLEQRSIAGCLCSLDAVITERARELDALKIHKQALMQSLFPSPQEAA